MIIVMAFSVCMTCGVELLYLRARVQLKRAQAACACCDRDQPDARHERNQ